MEKELLLAISDDRAASYNLRFLKEVFGAFCDLRLTLFYVSPRKGTWEKDPAKLKPRKVGFDESIVPARTKGEQCLKDAAHWIRDVAGCEGDNVRTKIVHSKKGTVQELVHEAHEGLYDAMLLGRRGLSWFEELFENSVSHELVWTDINFPIWICKRPPDNPRHDVLLCVDGSAASLRMVDHAGFMLAEEDQHTFTVFNVTQNGHDVTRSGYIFDQCLEMLKDNDVDEERIQFKIGNAKNVTKAIIEEAHEGRYSAVGVGKHGYDTNARKRGMFPSSVVVNLLRQLENASLWISK